jgi:hypothetical protein
MPRGPDPRTPGTARAAPVQTWKCNNGPVILFSPLGLVVDLVGLSSQRRDREETARFSIRGKPWYD